MYFLCKYLLIIANIVSVEKLVNFICLSTTYFYPVSYQVRRQEDVYSVRLKSSLHSSNK